jgi:hypothetical protein
MDIKAAMAIITEGRGAMVVYEDPAARPTAVIEAGKVVNIISAGPRFELPGKLLVPIEGSGADIGWNYADGVFSPPDHGG